MNADAKSRKHPMRRWREDPRALRRVTLRIWVQCWLILVWILLWGNISVANIVSGLAIALVISTALPMPPVPVEGRLHPLSLLRLTLRVTGYLVLSSLQVAWLAIKPGPPPLSAVLRAPMAIKSDLVLALAVNIVNLIPGSIVLEIDQARRLLYVHVIDVGSPRTVNQFYRQIAEVERLLVAAFERSSDWRPALAVDANLMDNDLMDNDLMDNDADEGPA
jgi:multicomponent Na+:H+ antiporter subunit E